MFHPLFGSEIAAIVVAITFTTSNHIDPVGTLFERPHDVKGVDLAGAGNADDFNRRRVTQSHRTCQVRGRVPSEITAKRNDNRFKVLIHKTPSSNESILQRIWSSSYQFS